MPNIFGTMKVVKIAWETDGYGQKKFKAYVQHTYPFEIQGFYLQGYDAVSKEDASYWCGGNVSANAVGTAVCANVQTSSKTFGIKAVVTTEQNHLALMKKLKLC